MRDGDVRTIKIRSIPRISLGELRNIAIRASRGSLFCQWDDDDWFHPERLATQYAYLRGNRADACLLNHWIVFDTKTGSAYISPKWNWEGSILCKRKAFSKNVSYAHISKGEDTVFINRLKKNHSIALLNRPHLYIYVYHGDNTWDRQHWDSNIFSSESYPLGDFFSSKIQEIISGHISGEATVRMLRSIHMISLVQYQK
jgi:glycosyltransferase involved in cell wall biosynthesis